MTEQELISSALDAGFDHAAIINVKDLTFDHSFRKYCEENLCGQYNQNYGCPPDCGTPSEMEARARAYRRALILQSVVPMENGFDMDTAQKNKRLHNQKTIRFLEKLRELQIEGLPMMAGPCAICKTCSKTEGQPCRFPEKVTSCLSAYCMNAEDMAQKAGMTYWYPDGKIGFYSLYLMNL